MRTATWAFVLGFSVLANGCIVQPSLHPLVTEEHALAVPEIVGPWILTAEEGDDSEDRLFLAFWAVGPRRYELLATEGAAVAPDALEVRFDRLGGELFWDATARLPKDALGLWRGHLQPVHGFARVRVFEDRLEVALLDPCWLERAVKNGELDLPHERIDHGILLTAPTDSLRRWIADRAQDEQAFGDTLVFQRMPAESESTLAGAR